MESNSGKNEEMEPKQKHPVVDVMGDGSKFQCYKQQQCIETWNVRSMNQGNLEVMKQEMARVNIDILRISKIKWMEWVNLTQMTITSTTAGRNPSEEMEQPSWSKKRVQNAVLGRNLKNDRMISVRRQGKPFNITVIQIYAPTVTLKKMKLNSSMKTYKTFQN